MTPATLKFLRDLLSQQQISAEHPQITEVAVLILTVRRELDQAIAEADG